MIKRSFALFLVLLPVLYATQLRDIHAEEYGQEHGGDIVFKDTKWQQPVLFSHERHGQAGNTCNDCHPGIFQKKRGSADVNNALTMRSMRKGLFCGACHDGKKAFKVSACIRCHSPTD